MRRIGFAMACIASLVTGDLGAQSPVQTATGVSYSNSRADYVRAGVSRTVDLRPGPFDEMDSDSGTTAAARAKQNAASVFPEWLAPIFSAAVPGAGQARLGESRFAAYFAIEAYGWIRFARHRSDGKRERDGYRSLAADVARALFSVEAPVGDFDYYEQMEKFIESGVYDAGEEEGVQPEPDESTYNGSLWRRARDTFWDDPNVPPPISSRAYQQSIAYYNERAVKNEFRWSWRNAQLQHDQFRRTIAGSNDAFRRSVQDLGVIIGNHVLSMVDAFISVRLRASAGAAGSGRGYSVTATLPVRAPAP